jgi:ferrous iron transport protein A
VSPAHPSVQAEAPPQGVVALTTLAPGDAGVIASVAADTGIGRRLLDLGFVPGTEISVVRRAPLGDPVTYALRGVQICLRRSEAARISVARR